MTPLNIAVKDTDETVVEMIVSHDLSNPREKKWLLRWLTDLRSETWEQYENLKNIETFQHYCDTNRLDSFPPKLTRQFSASIPNKECNRAIHLPVEQITVRTVRPPADANVTPAQRARGRPKKRVHG